MLSHPRTKPYGLGVSSVCRAPHSRRMPPTLDTRPSAKHTPRSRSLTRRRAHAASSLRGGSGETPSRPTELETEPSEVNEGLLQHAAANLTELGACKRALIRRNGAPQATIDDAVKVAWQDGALVTLRLNRAGSIGRHHLLPGRAFAQGVDWKLCAICEKSPSRSAQPRVGCARSSRQVCLQEGR
jgi:hypothetical protein